MNLIRKGKVKDIYDLDDDKIVFHFSDRVSAFDVQMATPIPRKGEILCKFGEFWFNTLGTPHHMLEVKDKDKMIVKRMTMIPIECIVRGYFYGSFVERYKNNSIKDFFPNYVPVVAGKLPNPIFDPTTKSEEHDIPITKDSAISLGLVTTSEYNYLEKTSIALYEKMSMAVEKAGFIMADVKFEFGRDKEGNILLGDSLGPDEYRLWLSKDYSPGKIQEAYDKQLLRDWLINVGFKAEVDRLTKEGKKPDPPKVPAEIANELSRRYVFAFEQISGKAL